MKKLILPLTLILLFPAFYTLAQEETKKKSNPITISGSADIYYKYDLSGYKNDGGTSNISTSFADQQNSLSVGMIDIALSHSVGKASFVGEVAFGPRNASSAGPGDGGGVLEPHIQNLYASYALTDKFSVTAGYMGTFVGYEVISPAGNFNYSTSYLFTSGPFQNAGVKLEYAFSDRFALMAGLFNDWNLYQDFDGMSDFGAQVYVVPITGWDVYLNLITGPKSGTEIDLTTQFQVSEKVMLGLNAADYNVADGDGGFRGAALYWQYGISNDIAVGFRGETFKTKDLAPENGAPAAKGTTVSAFTLSGNLKSGPLTFIPEFRFDISEDKTFINNDNLPAKAASQVLFAVVYAF